MPTIAFKSRIRTVSDNCTLDLVVSHRLAAGEPSATPRVVKNPPPKGVDILEVSPLIITMTGKLNNRKISAEAFMSSGIAQHLPDYLILNSSELGFEVVSDVHIAKDTGLPTLFCTASRPSRSLDVQSPHLKLLGFDMDYSWHETSSSSFPESSGLLDNVLTPFSSRLALPYLTALNTVVERFVKLQMVKRYPLIFGSWSQQLDMEKSYISSMSTSLSNILRRSSDLAFQESYGTRLRILEKARFNSLADLQNSISAYLESPSPLDVNKCQDALLEDNERIFIHAMERLYCLAMKRRNFKSILPSQNWLAATDDILCDQQPLLIGFNEELHSIGSDEEDRNMCWAEYAGIARGDTTLSEDLFASDSDQLDMHSGEDRFLRTTGSSSDAPHDDEPHDSFPPYFSSILDSLSADSDLDNISLTASPDLDHVDIFATKVSQLHRPSAASDSGIGSGASIRFASSCTETYRYHLLSEPQLETMDAPTDFTFSQNIFSSKFGTEDPDFADSSSREPRNEYSSGDVHLKGSCFRPVLEVVNLSVSAEADTVTEWESSVSGCIGGVDFVAMEF